MSEDVRRTLREAYDRKVRERDASVAPEWQVREREAFCALLQQEGRHSLLELGAATGSDGEFFRDHGLEVVCIDLSPEMIRRCEEKGLTAHVMDVSALRFPANSFDAVYAMNCLVHVPKAELPDVLGGIDRVLKPEGLLYVGVYGGYEHEGGGEWDPYEPKRFFAFYTDERLRRVLEEAFDVRIFRRIPHGWAGLHFQSVTLRRRRVAADGGSEHITSQETAMQGRRLSRTRRTR